MFISHVSGTLSFVEPWNAVRILRVIFLLGMVDFNMPRLAPLRALIRKKMRGHDQLPNLTDLDVHNANWDTADFARGITVLEEMFQEVQLQNSDRGKKR